MSEKSGFLGKMTSVTVDQGRAIRQIAVKLSNWNNIYGLRFIDDSGKHIVDEDWSEKGKWSSPKTVPEDNEIIGLKWVNTTFNECIQITRLGFLLWVPNPNAIE